jgi:Uma2 family endonuclease
MVEQPTTTSYESGINVDEFETIARAAGSEAEGIRLELIDGRLSAKTSTDGTHGWLVNWLMAHMLSLQRDLMLHQGCGLRIGAHRGDRAQPDGMLAPMNAFIGTGEWAPPEPVLMTLEVTSRDADTNRRSRNDMPRIYARTGIPIYLLIDRDSSDVVVHTEPDTTRYRVVHRYAFGYPVELPQPVGTTLDTTPLLERLGTG